MAKRKIQLACPGCGKPVGIEQPLFPFCSDRCRTLDLAKWADGAYVISTPITAADLLGDADYTVGAVERVPASSVKNEPETVNSKRVTAETERQGVAGEGETPKQKHPKDQPKKKRNQRKEPDGRRHA
jgi:uncharacterized protein